MPLFLNAAILCTIVAVIFICNVAEIKKCTKSKITLLWAAPLLIVVALCITITTFLLPFFTVYRMIIAMVLKIKHGSQFMGLLDGPGAFHAADKKIGDIIHSLIIVQCNKGTTHQEVFDAIKYALCKVLVHYKFETVLLRSFGYNYLLINDQNGEHVKVMKTIGCNKAKIDEEDLKTLINDYCNMPLPGSWEALVGTQLVEWESEDYDYYPFLFRTHHVVADGVTLWKLLVASLGEKQDRNLSNKEKKNALCDRLKLNLFHSAVLLKACLLAPATVIINVFLKSNDRNILRSTSLLRESVVAFRSEKDEDCVRKIKCIKNSFPGTGFPNVLLTAFSASIEDYFKQHSETVPDDITVLLPVLAGSDKLRYLTANDIDIKSLDVKNNYSSVIIKLPIGMKNANHLIDKLKFINEQVNIIKASSEYYTFYIIVKVVCAILPYPLVRFLMKWSQFTTVVSIIAEPPKVFNKLLAVNKLLFWVPLFYYYGTSLGIGTYQNKLGLTMTVDKALISDKDGVQSIIDGVFKYIDLLYFEVQSHNLKNDAGEVYVIRL